MTTTDWEVRFADRAACMTSSAIRELLKMSERPDFISFAGGFPAPEYFPIEEIVQVTTSILREDGQAALQYGPTEGYRPLREMWAQRFNVTVDNVLITTGSQQSLDLLGKVWLNRGDEVLVESPTYLAALQAWMVYGGVFRGFACDADGLQPDQLPAQTNAKFLYTIPTFQNPGGSTLSLPRRHQLVEWSQRTGTPLVEDDPYGELRFDGQPLPKLLELDKEVIYMTTYSKTLAPSLRVGVLVAPQPLVKKLIQAKQATDLHTSTLNQRMAYELDKSGFVQEHSEVLRHAYRQRRDAMVEALRRHFPAHTRCSAPLGGMFLWAALDADFDAVAALKRALEVGVAYVPGQYFQPDGSGHNTLRLNFSNCTPARIEEGIQRLAPVLYTDK